MMLHAKAWRESRGRFAIGVAVVAGLCVAFVVFADAFRPHAAASTYEGYIASRVYGGVVRALYMILAVVLGLGGLHRERSHGSLGFTLALPVRRVDHLRARVSVGLAQLTVLAILPAAIVPLLSLAVGESFPWDFAVAEAMVWLAVGAAVLGASFVASVIVPNDYGALVVALAARKAIAYLEPHLDRATGAVPWLVVAGFGCGALVLFVIAEQLSVRMRHA